MLNILLMKKKKKDLTNRFLIDLKVKWLSLYLALTFVGIRQLSLDWHHRYIKALIILNIIMFSIQSSEFNKILRNDFKKEALIEVALIFVYIYKYI